MKKIRMLSLFSGIGAPETAIKNLGYDLDVVNFCEIDKFAATSYEAIHNEDKIKNLSDVSTVDGTQFSDIDILFHGSPCTSFSNIGKGEGGDEGSGTKSSLMWETVRIVRESKPKVVIWENVKSVTSKKHIHNFTKYLEYLDSLGYQSTYKVITPQDVGEAQSRPRVFVVSMLDKKFEFPNNFVDSFKPLHTYLEKEPDDRYTLYEQLIRNFAAGHKSFTGRMRIQYPDGGCGCLVAKSGMAVRTNNYILKDLELYKDLDLQHNQIIEMVDRGYELRCFTPLEYWRLQGFTDDQFYIAQRALADTYKKGNLTQTDAQLYKQAGNSINVKVLESFIGDVLDEL